MKALATTRASCLGPLTAEAPKHLLEFGGTLSTYPEAITHRLRRVVVD